MRSTKYEVDLETVIETAVEEIQTVATYLDDYIMPADFGAQPLWVSNGNYSLSPPKCNEAASTEH